MTVAGRVGEILRTGRHPLRAAAMGLSALAIAFGLATTGGLLAAALGAALGVLLGELVARSGLRTSALLAALTLLAVLGWFAVRSLTWSTALVTAIGPGRSLAWASIVRFGVGAFFVVAALRVMAARVPALLGLELVAIAGALAAVFASHRDGIVARPLWLSDWAWQQGFDPVHVFLGIGAAAVVVLALLLVAESKRHVTVASIVALPLLALLAFLVLEVRGLPSPEAANDLGLTDNEIGEPPIPNDKQGQDLPNSGDGSQNKPATGQGGSGADGQQQQGGGGQGDPQQQPGGGGQGQQQQQGGGGQGEQQQQQQGGGGQGQQQQQQGSQQQPPDLNDMQPSSSQAPAPMAIVLLGDDYDPPAQAFYFRQEVWSHFNGSRLVPAVRADVDLDTIRSFPSTPVEVRELPPEQGRGAVQATVALLVEHARPFALEGVVKMAPEPNPDPKRFLRAYTFESRPQTAEYGTFFGKKPGNPEWSDEVREYYLAGPEDPRYAELAAELVKDLPEKFKDDPFAKALKIKLWMDANLAYKTAERHAGVPDPTADFLFGNRIGYCVHFAHAAVYMWRSLGVPARVGTGYHVEADQRQGSAVMIPGSAAHAWPELYLEGVGWVVLDIAAAENLDPQGQPGPDQDLTEMLAAMARKPPAPEQQANPAKKAERRPFGRDLAIGLGISLLVLVAALYVLKVVHRVAPWLAGAKAQPRVSYRLATELALEVGLVREWGETREAFARRVHGRLPSLQRLTDLHVAAALRDPATAAAARPEWDRGFWRRTLADLRRELPKVAPWWRRVLGALDPTTTLRSR
jgi:transglutaminase-like putative cysteine protease